MDKLGWQKDFDETCQAIEEDTVLLEALAAYVSNGKNNDVFPQVFQRLTDYLSQHATDLHNLRKRLGPDLQ